MSEKQLIQETKNSPKLFETVYDTHYQTIFNYIYRRTSSFDDSKYITSETFLKAYLKINNFVLNWIIRILLIFEPLAAIGINLISILHIHYEKPQKEIVISLKVKWLNWAIILICSAIFVIFFLYMIIENAGGH